VIFSDASAPDGPARETHTERRRSQQGRTARTAESTTISEGTFRVANGADMDIEGGALRVIDADGNVIALLGDDVDFGGASTGWRLNFKSGRKAIALGGSVNEQTWQLWDEAGNYLVTNDAITGVGLARPTFAIPLAPLAAAELSPPSMLPSTTATSAGTGILGILTPVWQPRLTVGAQTTTTGGGVGHWRLRINSLGLSTVVVSDQTGFAAHTVNIPDWGNTVNPGDQIVIILEAWVTGGGTRAFLQYDRCYTRGSA
jgi:hypothetical protein